MPLFLKVLIMDSNIWSIFPKLTQSTHNILGLVISGLIFLLVVILVSCIIGGFAANKWNGKRSKTKFAFILISSLVAIALFCFFGLSVRTIQGIILSLILLVASYSDIKTRECDDYLSVMLLLTAFIGIEISAIPSMFIAAMFTAGMFLLVVLFISNGIGGADIKIASACTFLLGFERGIIGLIAGLLIAILCNLRKSKKSGFPMVPYLTAAFIPAFFL